MPVLSMSGWQLTFGAGAALLLVAGLLMLSETGLSNLIPWSLFALAALSAIVCAKGRFRQSTPLQTLGDLARAVSALNAGALAEAHGAIRTREVWESLVWIARDATARELDIDRETRLIA